MNTWKETEKNGSFLSCTEASVNPVAHTWVKPEMLPHARPDRVNLFHLTSFKPILKMLILLVSMGWLICVQTLR